MEDADATKEENQQILKVLEALKQASHDLQSKSTISFDAAIKALLELKTESGSILSKDPYLSTLSHHLTNLKSIVDSHDKSPTSSQHGLRSFLTRRVTIHEISRVAGSIESEIQAWIDRQSIDYLARTLNNPTSNMAEQTLIPMLVQFEKRINHGFNHELQDLILKSKLFLELESALCNMKYSKQVREQVAFVIAELIMFNKDVFVGQVLMGQTIRALISMSSLSSLKVLCSLIESIKSPLVDEIESNGEIFHIISLIKSEELSVRVMAMNCVLEIGYVGRKEAIDAMLKGDLIKILVELQRGELGGDLIEVGKLEAVEVEVEVVVEGKGGRKSRERRYMEGHPFASCVARFAVQLEVGEGLRQREKRALKQEILKRVREACVSDSEAATIAAEVLWGSSP